MSLKIFLMPCHSILEMDELTLFHELGYEVFSAGSYISPENPSDPTMRPVIPGLKYRPDLLEQWHSLAATMPGIDPKYALSKEFVNNFDIIIAMHIPDFIVNNWEVMKHKRVIWRTIGQSVASTEHSVKPYRDQGLEIVRYSPMEARIPNFCGQDGFIRFYKDPEIHKDWNGDIEQVITVAQSMQERDVACNFSLFEATTRDFPRKLIGPGSETLDWGTGKLPFEEMNRRLRDSRAYFYTGTHPASYTLNFIESWMTGIPLICIGPKYGNASYFANHDLYEIPYLINNEVDGVYSDNPADLRAYIGALMTDHELAKQVSAAGRASAIRHFDKSMIKLAWKDFLER